MITFQFSFLNKYTHLRLFSELKFLLETKSKKYYAVKKGYFIGVYDNWMDARKQTDGVSHGDMKVFKNYDKAADYANLNENKNVLHSLDIYTDGSCLGNGNCDAKAGCGIWYGDNDDRNASYTIRGKKHDNNRAEILAISIALQNVLKSKNHWKQVVIHTDSIYSIGCLTQWYLECEKMGYTQKNGKPVVNGDIIKKSRKTIELLENSFTKVLFKHVHGHSGNYGNCMANCLARKGARGEGIYTDS